MTPKDWTLLVIAAAKGQRLSPVQLQKSLFLLREKLPLPAAARYEFDAYDYGPFCKAIYEDAEELEEVGFVFIERRGPYREYQATPDGLAAAEVLRQQLNETEREFLDRLVTWVRRLSFKTLVETVYAEFPQMRANSVFQS